MITKRTNIIVSAALMALAAVTITASAAMAARPHTNGPAGAPQNILVLTRDGKPVGGSKPPCLTNAAGAVVCANDLHFIWATPKTCKNGYEIPPVFVVWTLNGQVVWLNQPLTLAPCRANDFEFAWDANGYVTTASWTYNGHIIKSIPIGQTGNPNSPPKNDVHVFWAHPGRLLRAYWTLDGKPYGQPIKVPPGTNDAHWILG